jgi:hypothetical protein
MMDDNKHPVNHHVAYRVSVPLAALCLAARQLGGPQQLEVGKGPGQVEKRPELLISRIAAVSHGPAGGVSVPCWASRASPACQACWQQCYGSQVHVNHGTACPESARPHQMQPVVLHSFIHSCYTCSIRSSEHCQPIPEQLSPQ